MKKMFYIQYEAKPTLESEDFILVGGAFVNCLVLADTESKATELALANIGENNWEVIALEDGPIITSRSDYADEPEWLEWFDEASELGESYIYHRWPNEPQENNEIH